MSRASVLLLISISLLASALSAFGQDPNQGLPPLITTPPLAVRRNVAVVQIVGYDALVSERITYIIGESTPPVTGLKHVVDMLTANEIIDVTVQGFTSGVDAISVWVETDPAFENQALITWDFPAVNADVEWRVNYTLSGVVRSTNTHNSFNFGLVNRGVQSPQITDVGVLSVFATAPYVQQPWQLTPNATAEDITGGTSFSYDTVGLSQTEGYYLSISYPVQIYECLGAPCRSECETEDEESLLDKILAFLAAYWFLIVLLVICCVCCVLCIIGIAFLVVGVGGAGAGGVAYKLNNEEEDFDY